jgi:hypothetical protein
VWGKANLGRQFIHVEPESDVVVWHDQIGVVKRNVRDVCVNALRDALAGLGLPYVHKRYWPNGKQSAFCVRGDLDGGPVENLRSFVDSLGEAAACTTVFVSGVYADKPQVLRRRDKIT